MVFGLWTAHWQQPGMTQIEISGLTCRQETVGLRWFV
ncbi:hypothetical protein PPTG_23459 [Phytophthora nicotianae INRA-310]|uniref:Uncharacterized protein n=1 Tax=Phytophthora nicotianae (strain INRA-310) TaxID=761204 RepID=W2PZ24_PHYN3|nr:hypothetical protein PPTG_23459 [Phytophthora nicotianae INRA-310]ETN05886.1 hypothetical protein PPTG_23459 [Phytophthora nicotianae INRA-310]